MGKSIFLVRMSLFFLTSNTIDISRLVYSNFISKNNVLSTITDFMFFISFVQKFE